VKAGLVAFRQDLLSFGWLYKLPMFMGLPTIFDLGRMVHRLDGFGTHLVTMASPRGRGQPSEMARLCGVERSASERSVSEEIADGIVVDFLSDPTTVYGD
jgi:hypothetical protein